ncbi:hypothetical protein DY000_02040822 [Brassica cretica]|uniref:Uncharacterized protein n=1 Tax=Brassica cretica TaxID=69181 RepID=A0ABQ7BMP6_BRACR|nr:hypothetical protein DY000_02040822 [Brassica cretica]
MTSAGDSQGTRQPGQVDPHPIPRWATPMLLTPPSVPPFSVSPPIKDGRCSSTIESTLMPATVNGQRLTTFRHRLKAVMLTEPVSPIPEERFRFRDHDSLLGLAITHTQLPMILQPLGDKGIKVIGGNTIRCFTSSDRLIFPKKQIAISIQTRKADKIHHKHRSVQRTYQCVIMWLHEVEMINFEVFSQYRPGFHLWLPFCVMVRETKTHFGNDNDGDDKPDDNADLAKVETGGNVQQTTPDTGTVPNGEKPKTPSAEAASKAVKKARVDKSPQFYVFNNAMTLFFFMQEYVIFLLGFPIFG